MENEILYKWQKVGVEDPLSGATCMVECNVDKRKTTKKKVIFNSKEHLPACGSPTPVSM